MDPYQIIGDYYLINLLIEEVEVSVAQNNNSNPFLRPPPFTQYLLLFLVL
jgi:hypothetical protein